VPQSWAIVVLLAATVWCMFRRPAAGFLGGWFFLILAPTSSVAPITDLAFEHRMYLSLAAVVAAVVIAGYELWRRVPWPPAESMLRTALASLLVLAPAAILGWLTFARNFDYRSHFAIWEDTATKRPKNPRALVSRANLYHTVDKMKADADARAIEDYTRALKENPRFAKAYYHRANAYYRLGQIDLAIADFSEMIRADRNFAPAWHWRGIAHHAKSNYRFAIRDLTRAIEKRTGSEETRAREGEAFYHAGRYDEIARDFELSMSYHVRGDALLHLGRYEAARRDFERSIDRMRTEPKRDRELAKVHYLRGDALFRLGKYAAARDDFDRSIELMRTGIDQAKKGKEAPGPFNSRAWLLATCPDERLRDGRQAVADALRACELSDWKNAEYLDTLAAAYAESGDFNSAVRRVKEAIELDAGEESAVRKRQLELYREHKPYRDVPSTSSPSK
jgi:tetratricopeptide (TPR) repeat protein